MFSKAKLKRFNDVPVVSSPSPFVEPKEKEPTKKSKKEEKIKQGSMDAESIKPTKSALSLFRTPSLPKRLKFKHISDLTPKKSKEAAAEKLRQLDLESPGAKTSEKAVDCGGGGAKVPPIVQLYNKIDVNKEALQRTREENEELKARVQELLAERRLAESEKCAVLEQKDHQIMLLERELTSITKADELLQQIAEGCLEKVKENEEEIKRLHRDYERQLCEVHDSKIELELRFEELEMKCNELHDELIVVEGENFLLSDELLAMREIVEAHDMELQKKVDEIKEMEQSLNRLIKEGNDLKEQVNYFRIQAEEDMMKYVEESRTTIYEIDTFKKKNDELIAQLAEKNSIIEEMQEELNENQFEMDEIRDDVRNDFNQELTSVVKKYEQQIATLNEVNEMKIRECESIFVLEKSKMIKEHADKIKNMDKDHQREIERISEQAEEKIRISEVQTEERMKGLELSIQSSISNAMANEKLHWQKEMDKCQKIAETEIMQCEFEKRDLRALWEASNEVIKEHERKIAELERRLIAEMGGSNKTKDEYENELKELNRENARLQTEKYNYQLTLSNTRSTVNILMERLKKSDGDVETLKSELDSVIEGKSAIETENNKLREEIEEYRRVLTALRSSSNQLEKEMREKEEVFEKIMTSEEDAILTVSQIGKLFNEKMEESISRYLDMYDELKKKYDAREAYIQDMKTLLDEFATGIELARIELDTKDKKIFELENENKDIKLENMTFRFKCEQFEKYQVEGRVPIPSPEVPSNVDDEQQLVSNMLIENIINQLEKGSDDKVLNSEHIELIQEVLECDINKDDASVSELNEKLKETEEKLRIVEKFAKETSDKYTELLENQNNRQKVKNVENNKDHQQLKAKIAKLQDVNKKQENTILGLQQQLSCFDSPQKLNLSGKLFGIGSPKTPKKMISSPFPGKENRSPVTPGTVYSPRNNVLRPRNN
ncbi:putative leucine-rich repeat-containing protein DDB_G0290503 isoform X1 [Armigeres subalbatus]|uniref:putative leucine-rich repeat-containing protein DDB_G0290503 isoform X1 n=2 Tax=Armigeres subalbatus TaxID=124917 RepID=UPI002ECFD70A